MFFLNVKISGGVNEFLPSQNRISESTTRPASVKAET